MSGPVTRRSALTGSAVAALGLAGGVSTARASRVLSPNDARLVTIAAEIQATEDRLSVLSATHEQAEDLPEWDVLIERFTPLEEEMAETPADTLAGVLAKARASPGAARAQRPERHLRQSVRRPRAAVRGEASMRDLLPALPALVLPPFSVSSAPGSLASDVPGLVSDIERRFAALENYCHDLGDVPPHDTEFNRLDDLVTEAIHALADAPSRDMAGVLAKADALLRARSRKTSTTATASAARSLATCCACSARPQTSPEVIMLERRSFLRGLASLPLIGGSIALIGAPTKAAVPVTRPMLVEYADWLLFEHHMVKHEIYDRPVTDARYVDLPLFDTRRSWATSSTRRHRPGPPSSCRPPACRWWEVRRERPRHASRPAGRHRGRRRRGRPAMGAPALAGSDHPDAALFVLLDVWGPARPRPIPLGTDPRLYGWSSSTWSRNVPPRCTSAAPMG